MYVYTPVPPLAVTVAVPLLAPKQFILVEEIVEVKTGGSVIDVVAVAVHPPASVIFTV